MINQINTNQWSSANKPTDFTKQPKVEKGTEPASAEQSIRIDTLEVRKNQDEIVTYAKVGNNKKLDASDIKELKNQADRATENLRRLVERMILKQNKDYKVSKEGEKETSIEEKISAGDINRAKMSISEDGEFGVNAVSDRLVNFAISISGGDKAKFSELVAAIDEGFAAAKEALGGQLPDISQQTYDETMKKLKEWADS